MFMTVGMCNQAVDAYIKVTSGLPRSGKNIWKMKFLPGQGKVREFCG